MHNILQNLSLKQKIYQMFILGFEGTKLNESNISIQNALKEGLGGIIFFAQNFSSTTQAKELIYRLKEITKIPLYLSIDQEGGLVERTIMMDKSLDYLTPMALTHAGTDNIKKHYQLMSKELNSLGLNMNFAPVLDVNTNPKNPVIGIRAFSSNTQKVINTAIIASLTFQSQKICPVGKHFPGHGEAWVDSHKDMPVIDLTKKELEEIHIKPFKEAISKGLDALMIAHVHYKAFNNKKTPASLSKEVINDYLINTLKYDGLVISDDMVMGGIANHYDKFEALKMAINAGINLFIFKDSTTDIINAIERLEEAVTIGEIEESKIDESITKIFKHKQKYEILNNNETFNNFDYKNGELILDDIAQQTLDVKKDEKFEFSREKEYVLVYPDKSNIFNYSFDKDDFNNWCQFPISCACYSLNPTDNEIKDLEKVIQDKEVIFISYNATLNTGQFKLFNTLKKPTVVVCAGNPNDMDYFNNSEKVKLKIKTFCYKTPSLKALANYLNSLTSKVLEKR